VPDRVRKEHGIRFGLRDPQRIVNAGKSELGMKRGLRA